MSFVNSDEQAARHKISLHGQLRGARPAVTKIDDKEETKKRRQMAMAIQLQLESRSPPVAPPLRKGDARAAIHSDGAAEACSNCSSFFRLTGFTK